MKKYYTDSDGGCFLFGNENFSIKLPNDYGDCRNVVYVFDDYNEYIEFCKTKYRVDDYWDAFKWKLKIKGKFNLYNYDCSRMESKDVKVKLNGEYNIYLRSVTHERPNLAIVKKG